MTLDLKQLEDYILSYRIDIIEICIEKAFTLEKVYYKYDIAFDCWSYISYSTKKDLSTAVRLSDFKRGNVSSKNYTNSLETKDVLKRITEILVVSKNNYYLYHYKFFIVINFRNNDSRIYSDFENSIDISPSNTSVTFFDIEKEINKINEKLDTLQNTLDMINDHIQ